VATNLGLLARALASVEAEPLRARLRDWLWVRAGASLGILAREHAGDEHMGARCLGMPIANIAGGSELR
jgi:hypothetical protein